MEFVLSRHPKTEGCNLTHPSELEDGSILEIIGARRRGGEVCVCVSVCVCVCVCADVCMYVCVSICKVIGINIVCAFFL